MDMGKYVAVGVLAVILLAAVTYESPDQAKQASRDEPRLEGRFGGTPSSSSPSSTAETPSVTPTAGPTQNELSPPSAEGPVVPALPPNGAATAEVVEAPAPAANHEAAELAKDVEYTVKAGQTLYAVAKEFLGDGTRWKELYERNKERIGDPDRIREGMKLVFPQAELTSAPRTLPASAPRAATSSVGNAPQPPAGGRTYTVQKGDTLYAIASRELGSGGRWKELIEINGLRSEQVRAGRVIALPPK